eukprot:1151772-Pelagomonas_calceolata.AAC.2
MEFIEEANPVRCCDLPLPTPWHYSAPLPFAIGGFDRCWLISGGSEWMQAWERGRYRRQAVNV